MKRICNLSTFTYLTIHFMFIFVMSCKTEDPNTPKLLPILTTTAITKITQNTAFSGGFITSDGGLEVIARGVCWSLKPNPTINDSTTKDAAGTGEFISSITNLIADTTYYVRAYATNNDGTAYGLQVIFKTLVSVLPILTTTPISDITVSSATSGGNITFNGGTAVTARGVCWNTNSNPTILNNKTSDSSGTESFLSTISGLNQAKVYYIRAYATNSAGTAYGNELSFKTNSIYEEGFYITGNASSYSTIDIIGQFKSTPLEQMNNQYREGLVEKYVALESGKTFTITEVVGANINVYGPGNDFATVTQNGAYDELSGTLQKGKYSQGSTFSVPTSGLYHVVIDKQTTSIAIMPVSKWAIIGSATPLGWADNDMTKKGSFSKDTLVYEINNITLLKGEFKFRHSGAWKQTIVTNPLVKVNTNLSGTSMTTLVPGGVNIPFLTTNSGIYSVNATWGKNTGMKFLMKKTGNVTLPNPSTFLYSLIGNAFNNASGLPAFWDYDLDLNFSHSSGVDLTTYSGIYTYKANNVKLLAGGEFKVRKNHLWDPSYGYVGTNIRGDVTNFLDYNGNIKVIKTTTYSSVEFEMTYPQETWKLTLTK